MAFDPFPCHVMTTLRLVHSGFGPGADFDEEYDGISQGWPVELRSLRHYLENHAGSAGEPLALFYLGKAYQAEVLKRAGMESFGLTQPPRF